MESEWREGDGVGGGGARSHLDPGSVNIRQETLIRIDMLARKIKFEGAVQSANGRLAPSDPDVVFSAVLRFRRRGQWTVWKIIAPFGDRFLFLSMIHRDRCCLIKAEMHSSTFHIGGREDQ